jgi:hypothetical protein
MGRVIEMGPAASTTGITGHEKRRTTDQDYVRGQQVIANAIFHWRHDHSEDARAAVRVLLHHLATNFRVDDEPLRPKPIEAVIPADSAAGDETSTR